MSAHPPTPVHTQTGKLKISHPQHDLKTYPSYPVICVRITYTSSATHGDGGGGAWRGVITLLVPLVGMNRKVDLVLIRSTY